MLNIRNSYRKQTFLLAAITAAALLVCAVSFVLKRETSLAVQSTAKQTYTGYYIAKPSSSQETAKVEVSPSPVPAPESSALSGGTSSRPEDELYLITVHEGKIGVFRSGESTPFLLSDIDVYLLPEEDLSILRKGIRVTSFGAVKGVLEDYE